MPAQVLERGNIYFAYRPKVMEEKAESAGDVQRFYMILSPHGKRRYRTITLGRKRLPEPEEHERFWGFVDAVGTEAKQVETRLGEETYQTKTRGERVQPAARPAGEGRYAIYRHGDHTGLAYVLELPEGPGPVQKALNIQEEARYVISVKNPTAPSPSWADLQPEREAEFPKHLEGRFGDRKFADLDPPDFLNYEGAEIIMIGASGDIEELEIRLDPQKETVETAEIFRDLRMEKSEHPIEPLVEGEWE